MRRCLRGSQTQMTAILIERLANRRPTPTKKPFEVAAYPPHWSDLGDAPLFLEPKGSEEVLWHVNCVPPAVGAYSTNPSDVERTVRPPNTVASHKCFMPSQCKGQIYRNKICLSRIFSILLHIADLLSTDDDTPVKLDRSVFSALGRSFSR